MTEKKFFQLSYVLYQRFSQLYAKIAFIHLAIRKKFGKETEASILQKTGFYHTPRPAGKVIRVHGASVGESVASLPLIRELIKLDPSAHVLLTTGTVTSERVIGKLLGERTLHQFAPLDFPQAVKRFYEYWRPDLEIYLESELWANAIFYANVKKIPIFMVNGRMSERSAGRRRERAEVFTQQILSCFEKIYVQGYDNYKRYALFAPKVKLIATENLKWIAAPAAFDRELIETHRKEFENRSAFCVMSAAPNEFEYFADRFKELKLRLPNILCVFVPRHPEKGAFAEEIFQKKGLKTARRSLNQKTLADTDMYIADTIGETALWFSVCKVTFMGKSVFAPGGGQNPVEPFYLKSVVICGEHTDNFTEIYREAERFSCIIRVSNAQETSDAIFYLLTHAELRKKAIQNTEALLMFKSRGVKSDLSEMARTVLAALRRKYHAREL